MAGPDRRATPARGQEPGRRSLLLAGGLSLALHGAAAAGLYWLWEVRAPAPLQAIEITVVGPLAREIASPTGAGSRAGAPAKTPSPAAPAAEASAEPREAAPISAAAPAPRPLDPPQEPPQAPPPGPVAEAEAEPVFERPHRFMAPEPAPRPPTAGGGALLAAPVTQERAPAHEAPPSPIVSMPPPPPPKPPVPHRAARLESAAAALPRPLDTRPPDTRPADTRPLDTRPAHTRPAGDRPIDAGRPEAPDAHDRRGQAAARTVALAPAAGSLAAPDGGPGRAAAGDEAGPRFTAQGLANPAPRYPYLARRRGQDGRVVLRVSVSPQGEAEAVSIRLSSGHRLLDAAAVEAVTEWRFVPAYRAGSAVAGAVDVPITFKLTD